MLRSISSPRVATAATAAAAAAATPAAAARLGQPMGKVRVFGVKAFIECVFKIGVGMQLHSSPRPLSLSLSLSLSVSFF